MTLRAHIETVHPRKRGPGRPRKRPADRAQSITVRLGPSERAILERLAWPYGDSPSTVLRRGLHALDLLEDGTADHVLERLAARCP